MQHHEWWSGAGYPHRRAGKQIFRLARILAPAAAYVSLIADRPYRRGYLPHEALEYLVAYAGDWHDAEVVQALVATLPAYPFGTRVLLDGQVPATVTDPNATQPGRPIVRLDDGRLIDLSAGQHLQRSIVGVCAASPVEPVAAAVG
jgi:HD-GYP domain-containing protein (c-di-GMP phosphodiesterase class II)